MTAVQDHEHFMRRCIELASQGFGSVSPNPMVGAVIVHDGKIISEGFHRKFGGQHAEIDALNSVADKSKIKDSTIYVSLEPCSHTGKTPPCSLALIEAGFKSVVIAQSDPNPKVSGNGIKILREKGIDVTIGVLEEEARELNKRFNCFHERKRPYVFLKWAETRDRFVDHLRQNESDHALVISGKESRDLVHYMRSNEDAFLVGFNTALKDKSRLSNRLFGEKQPLRVVLDPECKLDEKLPIFNQEANTLIINNQKDDRQENIERAKIDFRLESWPSLVLNLLWEKEIQSLVIEGGPKTHQAFVEQGLWDEYYRFIADFEIKKGVKAIDVPLSNKLVSYKLGKDRLEIGRA